MSIRKLACAALACGVLLACAGQQTPVAAEQLILPYFLPRTVAQHRTTDASVYLANLNAVIERLEQRQRTRPSATAGVQLGTRLLERFQILGRMPDLAAAQRAVREAMELRDIAAGQLLVARVATMLHRFDDARQAIDRARALGADAGPVEQEIEAATFLSLPPPSAVPANPADPFERVARANRLVELGEPAAAIRALATAQDLYQDTNPFALAWIQVQTGIVYLRHGQLKPARVFFEAAHQRMPPYFLAAEHLAEVEMSLGNTARAAELYREVAAQTDNPVFWDALAAAEAALGNQEAAAAAEARAQRLLTQELEAHPEAWWQHAAELALDRGDFALADDLARRNLDLRETVGSLLLAAEAAVAMGEEQRACDLRKRAWQSGNRPPELLATQGSCGSPDR